MMGLGFDILEITLIKENYSIGENARNKKFEGRNSHCKAYYNNMNNPKSRVLSAHNNLEFEMDLNRHYGLWTLDWFITPNTTCGC